MYDQTTQAELIRFSGVKAGATVIDVWPGEGEWTRLFSAAVGPEGRVFGFVPAEILQIKDDAVDTVRAIGENPEHANVEAASADVVRIGEVTPPTDLVWMHLFYHDMHTKLIQAKGATAAAFTRAVHERLKSGGVFVIVDHAAAGGTGTTTTEELHRIDPATVREEVEAAGFALEAESLVLANAGDPHAAKVFDPSIKGKTDRFAYRFRRV